MDRAMLELSQIISDARVKLFSAFTTGTIYFWTDSHRRESYAVMMIDLVAEKYKMVSRRTFFMSRKTKSEIDRNLIVGDAVLDVLETPLNFERFEGESES